MELVGTYHGLLVITSIIAAIGSSFVAISIVPRIYISDNKKHTWLWIAGFGMSLGTGIWTMHFIAILAFKLPIVYTFDLPLTLLSLLLAIVASGVSIIPLRTGASLSLKHLRTYIIGTLMGLSIAGMHYTGMAALRINAVMHHDMAVILLAVAIAIIASIAALAIANNLRSSQIFQDLQLKLVVATVMGIAVSAMHYTAMEGMHFHASDLHVNLSSSIDATVLAIFLIVIAFLMQGTIIAAGIFEEMYVISNANTANMERRAKLNQALSDILAVGLKKESLAYKMERVLEIVLGLNCLPVKDTGSIFIIDSKDETRLQMIAHRHLPKPLVQRCKHIKFGECLCGKAADSQKIVFKNCVDHDHSVNYSGIEAHGHYCIPVVFVHKTLAVINLYLEAGSQKSDEDEQFLVLVGDAVASMIHSHHVEENAQKIFTAVDQAGEAILISDPDGVIEYTNAAFSEITGYSKEEAFGRSTSLLKSGHQDDAFYENLWGTVLAGDVWQGEVVQRRKDGSFYPAMLTVSPCRNGRGDVTHYIGIHEDLSGHKKLEAQFRQAQKMDAIGSLVGGIAHDFNNMLAAIAGNVYLAKTRAGDIEQVEKRLHNIETVAGRAAMMIKQLLTFSRKDMVSMQELAFHDFVKEVIPLLQSSIPENIQVNLHVEPGEYYVFGDQTLLHQVVMNLMINARDAVEGVPNPVVQVSASSFHANQLLAEEGKGFEVGDYVHLNISDNGAGISKENIVSIFEPFFTTKEQGKGTGLGLSMVFGAIQSHGGVIDVESKLNEGTSFHVYLPLVQQVQSSNIEEDDVDSEAAQGETILVVDDEHDVRETTAEVLESFGYKVLQAGNGEEGLKVFRTHHQKIGLALLDVVMPRLGGVGLAKEIRKVSPSLPVIFMTGYDRENVLKDCEGFSNCEVVAKPAQYNIISHMIRRLIG